MLRALTDRFEALALNGRLVYLGLLLSLALHAPFSAAPPRWTHAWRQCNTLAVARNFYQEGADILAPRVDRRMDQAGVTGMQFPAYECTVAWGYHVFGERHAVERLVQFAFFAMGAVALQALLLQLSGSALLAGLGAWAFCFSPDLFYFGFSALPDVLALSMSLVGLVYFVRWFERGGLGNYGVSLAAVTVAGLTKIQFLAVGFPILAYVLVQQRRVRQPGFIALLAAYALVAVAVSLAWYAYALHLIAVSGLHDFGIRFHGAAGWADGIRIAFHNLVSDVPETSLGYPSAVFLVLGLASMREPWRRAGLWAWPLLLWTASVLAYYFIELGQMRDHSYYLFPLLPPLFIGVAKGAQWLWRRQRGLAFALLLLLPLLTAARMLPRWFQADQGLPVAFQDPAALGRLVAAAGAGERCIVGPDGSGCIYLYYLQKKGWSYADGPDLEAQVAEAARRGATALYTDNAAMLKGPRTQACLGRLRLQEGVFQVWDLHPPAGEP